MDEKESRTKGSRPPQARLSAGRVEVEGGEIEMLLQECKGRQESSFRHSTEKIRSQFSEEAGCCPAGTSSKCLIFDHSGSLQGVGARGQGWRLSHCVGKTPTPHRAARQRDFIFYAEGMATCDY